jgi:hypothetical protein
MGDELARRDTAGASLNCHGGRKARGMGSVQALKSRCIIDPVTHCWQWQGAFSAGEPRLWAFDHALGDKRVMTGPAAAWNIAHDAPVPRGKMVFRGCMNRVCLNPAHLRLARSLAEVGEHQRRAGTRKGRPRTPAQAAANQRMRDARGLPQTPPEIVRAIRAAPAGITNVALAAQHGVAHQTVSRIRRGESHRGTGDGERA